MRQRLNSLTNARPQPWTILAQGNSLLLRLGTRPRTGLGTDMLATDRACFDGKRTGSQKNTWSRSALDVFTLPPQQKCWGNSRRSWLLKLEGVFWLFVCFSFGCPGEALNHSGNLVSLKATNETSGHAHARADPHRVAWLEDSPRRSYSAHRIQTNGKAMVVGKHLKHVCWFWFSG